jgi:pilus assembly protein Flp/PilA
VSNWPFNLYGNNPKPNKKIWRKRKMIKKFFTDESGVTAIEYGLIAALIAVGIIASLQALGPKVASTFQTAADAMP